MAVADANITEELINMTVRGKIDQGKHVNTLMVVVWVDVAGVWQL